MQLWTFIGIVLAFIFWLGYIKGDILPESNWPPSQGVESREGSNLGSTTSRSRFVNFCCVLNGYYFFGSLAVLSDKSGEYAGEWSIMGK